MEFRWAGQLVQVTPGHEVWSRDRNRWVGAHELLPGEQIRAAGNYIAPVESTRRVAQFIEVFGIEVEYFHNYFVGTGPDAILVHNGLGCVVKPVTSEDAPSARSVHDRFVHKVRPGATEKVFETPWSRGKGLGSRKFDDFDEVTGTAFEGNTTPWSRMTQEQLSRKLDQVGSDFALLQQKQGPVKRIVWFGTEPLPTTSLGGQLREALQKAGIKYTVVKT